jgi:hydrogenase expression/formation protein HypC
LKENIRGNMCIAIPGKIKSIVNESIATVDMGGICRNVNMDLLGGASESMIGKHVLVHVGYAINEISEEESEETMKLLRQIAGLDEIDTLENESP